MQEQKQTVGDYMGALAEAASALVAATADVAGEKVGEARRRLAAALEHGKEVYGQVRDKAVETARTTDEAVRDHPYQIIGLALAVGVIAGLLVARRDSSDCH